MIRVLMTPLGGVLAVGEWAEVNIHRYLNDAIGATALSVPWRQASSSDMPLERLCWQSRYSAMTGHEAARAQLLAWARDGSGVRARVLVGPAGAGKSRVAAEVASVLRDDGWVAGVVGWDEDIVRHAGPGGTFVVVDEPEPWGISADALARLENNAGWPGAPVRLVILSRSWSEDGEWPGLSTQRLEPLSTDEAASLHEQVVEHYFPAGVAQPQRAFRTWIEDSETAAACRPLDTIAAALYVCHPPWDGDYPDDGRAAMRGLVNASWRSLDLDARRVGLAADVLPLFVALADTCGGLDEDDVRRIAVATSLTQVEPEGTIDRLSRLARWRNGRLEACLDGLARGAFLRQAFADVQRKNLGVRIAAARPITRLSQLLRLDRDLRDAGADERLCRFLADVLPVRDLDLDLRAIDPQVPAGSLLGRLALRSSERLAPEVSAARHRHVPDGDDAEALILLARHRAREEGAEMAIEPAREAVALYRRLVDRDAHYRADLDDAIAFVTACVGRG
jgi:hypothetical protein